MIACCHDDAAEYLASVYLLCLPVEVGVEQCLEVDPTLTRRQFSSSSSPKQTLGCHMLLITVWLRKLHFKMGSMICGAVGFQDECSVMIGLSKYVYLEVQVYL
jgi:hypothetical protein